MKRILAIWLCLLAVLPLGWGASPTVITQLTTNVNTLSGYLNAAINPNGTNTTGWFRFGTDSTMSQTLSNTFLGKGSTNVSLTAYVSGLLPGTRYYYQAQASNDSLSVTSGNMDQFATTQISYDVTGTGLSDLDPTRPQGSEPISVWDDALRQTRQMLLNWVEVEHNLDGTMQQGVVITPYISDGAVTFPKLDPYLRNLILAAGGTNGFLMVTTNVACQTANPGGSTLASIQVPTNTCTKITVVANLRSKSLVTAGFSHCTANILATLFTNNIACLSTNLALTAYQTVAINFSQVIVGATNGIPVSVSAQSIIGGGCSGSVTICLDGLSAFCTP